MHCENDGWTKDGWTQDDRTRYDEEAVSGEEGRDKETEREGGGGERESETLELTAWYSVLRAAAVTLLDITLPLLELLHQG